MTLVKSIILGVIFKILLVDYPNVFCSTSLDCYDCSTRQSHDCYSPTKTTKKMHCLYENCYVIQTTFRGATYIVRGCTPYLHICEDHLIRGKKEYCHVCHINLCNGATTMKNLFFVQLVLFFVIKENVMYE